MKKKEIDWTARLDILEKQLGIRGSFHDKPCCAKCEGTGLKVMELSKDKTRYICPRCKNTLKVEDFKRWCSLPINKPLGCKNDQ